MKLFEEFLNQDGKDAQELPVLILEERLLTEPATAPAAAHQNVHETPTLTDWTTLFSNVAVWSALMQSVPASAQRTPMTNTAGDSALEPHPKDAMDWSTALIAEAGYIPESLNPSDWIVFPTDLGDVDVDTSPLPPLSAGSPVFATPSPTPALLLDQFDSNSPEYDAVSPMFAASSNASPAFKTSPTFSTHYSPLTLGADDAFVYNELLQVAPATTSSSSSSSADFTVNEQHVLTHDEVQVGVDEPTITIPIRALQSLLKRVKACTCHAAPSIDSAAHVSSKGNTPVSPAVPLGTAAPVDPFATRRRRVPTKLYVCSHLGCGKTFTRRFNLQTHEETHNPHRPREHTCVICGKRFTRSHDLTRHAAVHDDEKHACQGCGKGYSRSDALRRHMGKCEGLAGANAYGNASGIRNQITPTLVKLQ